MKQVVIAVMFALFTLNNVSAQTKYKEINDISYVSPNDTSSYRQERCKLDLYYPTDANRPFKTIVWFHGGGLTEGHKDIPGDLKNQGVAVVAPLPASSQSTIYRGRCGSRCLGNEAY